jgi:hypothetical protein
MIGFTNTFFVQSLLITTNYKNSLNLQPNPSSLTAEDSLHSRSRSTTDFVLIYEPLTSALRMTSQVRRNHLWVWVSHYDQRSVGQSESTHLRLTARFLLLSDSCGFLDVRRSLSDERTGLSFKIAPGPRQRSHFRVRVPWDSWPYFTVSDSRLPFSSLIRIHGTVLSWFLGTHLHGKVC